MDDKFCGVCEGFEPSGSNDDFGNCFLLLDELRSQDAPVHSVRVEYDADGSECPHFEWSEDSDIILERIHREWATSPENLDEYRAPALTKAEVQSAKGVFFDDF